MAGLDGEFVLHGRTFSYEVLEIHDIRGRDWTGPDIEDHIQESDTVFYVAKTEDDAGETEEFFRWLGGPFESINDVEAAIADETDVYESA